MFYPPPPLWRMVRCIRLKNLFTLKRIWILFAWYSLVSYFSHTSYIRFIRLYSLQNIRFNLLQNIHFEANINFNSRFCFRIFALKQTNGHCLLPTLHCALFTDYCLHPTFCCPLSTCHCYYPLSLSTAHSPLTRPLLIFASKRIYERRTLLWRGFHSY